MGMVKLVEREGLCLDVVSGGELYTALQAGFPPERIEFNGNNKLPAELEMAVEAGIGRIIVDGLQELSLLEGICAARGRKMKVLFRVTPAVDSHTHAYISTGKKDSKFGIPMDPEILWPLVERALSSQWVDFLGFHFHVGSQLHENGSHLAALETVLDLSGEMWRRWKRPVRELNIGGGFSARYLPGEPRQPWSYFLDPVMERVEARFSALGLPRPAVVIEPGRSIVAEAGLTLYTVGSVKDIPGGAEVRLGGRGHDRQHPPRPLPGGLHRGRRHPDGRGRPGDGDRLRQVLASPGTSWPGTCPSPRWRPGTYWRCTPPGPTATPWPATTTAIPSPPPCW